MASASGVATGIAQFQHARIGHGAFTVANPPSGTTMSTNVAEVDPQGIEASKQMLDSQYDRLSDYAGADDNKNSDASDNTDISASGDAQTEASVEAAAQGGGDTLQMDDLADTYGSQITDAQLKKLFGENADKARELFNSRGDVTVGDMLPLMAHGNFDAATELLEKRSDLQPSDLMVSGNPDGTDDGSQKTANPMLQDRSTMLLLEGRNDVKPQQMFALHNAMIGEFGSIKGPEAYTRSLSLMNNRPDITPEQISRMAGSIGGAVAAVTPPGQAGQSTDTMFAMFNEACTTLEARPDVKTTDMGALAEKSATVFGDRNDAGSLENVQQGFHIANTMLRDNKNVSVQQVMDTMDAVNNGVPGEDQGGNRLEVFNSAARLEQNNSSVNAHGISTMLDKAKQRSGGDPSGTAQEFNATAGDVMTGRISADTATTPSAKLGTEQQRQENQATHQHHPNDPARNQEDPNNPHQKKHGHDQPGTPQTAATSPS